jgi:general secretion pathway protein C
LRIARQNYPSRSHIIFSGSAVKTSEWLTAVVRARWLGDLLILGVVAAFLASGAGWLMSRLFEVEPDIELMALAPIPTAPRDEEPITARRDAEQICERNVFDFTRRPCVEPVTTEPPETVIDEEPELPPLCEGSAHLVGTVVSKRRDWSFAMIETEGKAQPYRVGDDVDELGEVEQIGWRLVLVDRTGDPDCLLDVFEEQQPPRMSHKNHSARRRALLNRRKALQRKRAARAKTLNKNIDVVSPTERNVSRSFVDQLTENPTSLMRTVRVRPYSRDGQIEGFKLYRIRRNTLLARLGFRNGDLIRSVNGVEITGADRALAAYTKLKRASHLTVTIERRGQPMGLDFNVR